MRVRVDAHGRAKKPQSSTPSPSSSPSTNSSRSIQPPKAIATKPHNTKPLVHPPPSRSNPCQLAQRTSAPRPLPPPPDPPKRPSRPPTRPVLASRPASSRATSSRVPTRSAPSGRSTLEKSPYPYPRVSVSQTQTHDDARSDSGSSVATEAYNSEDEHPQSTENEVPMRTLREREDEFSAMLAGNGLCIIDMRADGNCLFRALAHSVWNDAEKHMVLRQLVMQYLVQERDYFSQFVAEDFVRYVRRKSRDGTHGNHLELQAAAELFARPIEVYSYSASPATIIDAWGTPTEADAPTPEPIRLSFHRGSHYNAVQPTNYTEKNAKRAAEAAAVAEEEARWRGMNNHVQDEVERAVLALSLVEATRGDSSAGSASSSAASIPSAVLALVNMGYSEDVASDAYRVAGPAGLPEMIRYVTNRASSSRRPPLRRQRPRFTPTSTLTSDVIEPSTVLPQRPVVETDIVQQEIREQSLNETENVPDQNTDSAHTTID